MAGGGNWEGTKQGGERNPQTYKTVMWKTVSFENLKVSRNHI